MSIGAAFALVIFPPAGGMTLLVSELVFATRAKREAVERIVSVVLVHDALASGFFVEECLLLNAEVRGDEI